MHAPLSYLFHLIIVHTPYKCMLPLALSSTLLSFIHHTNAWSPYLSSTLDCSCTLSKVNIFSNSGLQGWPLKNNIVRSAKSIITVKIVIVSVYSDAPGSLCRQMEKGLFS